MATRILKNLKFTTTTATSPPFTTALRSKTTSSQYVSSRARDPTFEKHMTHYKNLLKVISIQDLILSNNKNPPSISLDFLTRLSQTLHLNRGAAAFLHKYPHIFHVFYDPSEAKPYCRLTETALEIARLESATIAASEPVTIDRLVRLLSMTVSKSLPLRAIFKVWREVGLPDDFEDSVISKNPDLFELLDAHEPNTHILKLRDNVNRDAFSAAVENWRVIECCREDDGVDRTEIRFSFKHGYPPGMRLSKNFRAKVKEWQRLPYVGPYEEMGEKKRSKRGMMEMEKRAVGIVHEFLSLTVEKTVEVEKISHFRKCFGIDLNIRDLFLDHPGMFYLSTKGKRHTVFLREAYERGCLIEPNPVYNVRRKLLNLVLMGRRGFISGDSKLRDGGRSQVEGWKKEEND
ncbi:protein ROOT PRIMORDIUM DEFECTIVE 1 [Rhododendron vialii]|uniref:protein ROOT PRIMORDIUM DEFECTIVE 1 n=1 Tax=Rhododendron vialii TaxID=182163 RepID=UPI00265FD353|nr:protein ROOT PRIMORDIUM DEFECTIVE 1 [Rhododendron vialii]XP_058185497.1 protein ROOT PRIMORDIUM DEFECTIVE 1 [Rhododendron vialii]XP_058185498.1 protein ROOT PRIMORDIUM DEFECTIVE 1 [Rhododendron vialii]XP_058185500.1 protein ROOT PRIMORDIUM DEFECTIVE 1 [Rhododendron vialii]